MPAATDGAPRTNAKPHAGKPAETGRKSNEPVHLREMRVHREHRPDGAGQMARKVSEASGNGGTETACRGEDEIIIL